MSEPTSGPWILGYPLVNSQGLAKSVHRGESPNWGICTMTRAFSEEETDANARLIAAAPETAAERDRLREVNTNLLAVLKAFVDAYDGFEDSVGDPCPVVAQAKVAIARAEGKAQ